MAKIKVHPIQQKFKAVGDAVVCEICGSQNKPRNAGTAPRVTHLVHLVQEHLELVNKTFSSQERKEEIVVDVDE